MAIQNEQNDHNQQIMGVATSRMNRAATWSLILRQQDTMMEGPMMSPSQNKYDPDFLPCMNLVKQIRGTWKQMKNRKIGLIILKIMASKNSCSMALNRKVIICALFLLSLHLTISSRYTCRYRKKCTGLFHFRLNSSQVVEFHQSSQNCLCDNFDTYANTLVMLSNTTQKHNIRMIVIGTIHLSISSGWLNLYADSSTGIRCYVWMMYVISTHTTVLRLLRATYSQLMVALRGQASQTSQGVHMNITKSRRLMFAGQWVMGCWP